MSRLMATVTVLSWACVTGCTGLNDKPRDASFDPARVGTATGGADAGEASTSTGGNAAPAKPGGTTGGAPAGEDSGTAGTIGPNGYPQATGGGGGVDTGGRGIGLGGITGNGGAPVGIGGMGTGGSPHTGGMSGTGGVFGTGGPPSTGGSSSTGGSPSGVPICSESTTRSCATDGLMGNCAKGMETCVAGKWGACGISAQVADSCSVAGDDANCNGAANEGCVCVGSTTRSCALDGLLGNCAKGTETCVGGQWGVCSVVRQANDSCAVVGDDANCDGMPNKGCTCVTGATNPCGPQIAQGICKQGTQTCTANAWGPCQGAVYQALRNCMSALDNDCDGRPDNTIDSVCQCTVGQSVACGAHAGFDGKGPCKPGTQACVAGANGATSSLAACLGAVGPAASDTCDPGNDANCNGNVNDSTPSCTCLTGATRACGNCNLGTEDCVAGIWGLTKCRNAFGPPITYYADSDMDGYGNPLVTLQSCIFAPVGYVSDNHDCCDLDAGTHPGASTGPYCIRALNECGSFDIDCSGNATPAPTCDKPPLNE
jgi:hypothetical protein